MGRRDHRLQILAKQEEISKAALNAILSRDENVLGNNNIYQTIASEASKSGASITAGYIETHVMPQHHAALASIKQGKTDADLKAAGFSDSIVENARKQHIRDVVDEQLKLKTREADPAKRSDDRKKILEAIELNTNKHDGSLVTNPFNKDEHKEALYLPGEDDGIQAAARLVAILQAHKPELHASLKAKESDYQNSLAKVDEEIKKAIDDLYGTSGSLKAGKVTDEAKQRKLSVIIKKFKDKDLSSQSVTLTTSDKEELLAVFGNSGEVDTAIGLIFDELHKTTTTAPAPDWATNSKGRYKDVVKLSADEVFDLHSIKDNKLKEALTTDNKLREALTTVIDSFGNLNIPVTPQEDQYANRLVLKRTEVDANTLAQVLQAITEDTQSIADIESELNTYRLITPEQAVKHHLKGAGAEIATLIQPDGSLVPDITHINFKTAIDAVQLLMSGGRSIANIAGIFGLIILDVANKGAGLPETSQYIVRLREALIVRAIERFILQTNLWGDDDLNVKHFIATLVGPDGTVKNLGSADLTVEIQTYIKAKLASNTIGDIATRIEAALKYVDSNRDPRSTIDTKKIILTTIVENILETNDITGTDIKIISGIITTYFIDDNGKVIDPATINLATAEKQQQLQSISSSATALAKAIVLDKVLESIDPRANIDAKKYKKFFTTIVYTEADYTNGIATAEQFCMSNIVNLPEYKIGNVPKIIRSIMLQKPIIGWLEQLIGELGKLDGELRAVSRTQAKDFVQRVQTALGSFPKTMLCMDGEEEVCGGIKLEKEMEPFCLDITVMKAPCNYLKDYVIGGTDRKGKIKDFINDMTKLKTLLSNATTLETEKIFTTIDCKISGTSVEWTLDYNALGHVQDVLNDNEQACPDVDGHRELCPIDIAGFIGSFSVSYNVTSV